MKFRVIRLHAKCAQCPLRLVFRIPFKRGFSGIIRMNFLVTDNLQYPFDDRYCRHVHLSRFANLILRHFDSYFIEFFDCDIIVHSDNHKSSETTFSIGFLSYFLYCHILALYAVVFVNYKIAEDNEMTLHCLQKILLTVCVDYIANISSCFYIVYIRILYASCTLLSSKDKGINRREE